jgi:alkylation response protein AidB-like acyl-CoA dehydrogenase
VRGPTGFPSPEQVPLQDTAAFVRAAVLHVAEVERHHRDARVLGIGGGATEVLDDLTATLLGYDA